MMSSRGVSDVTSAMDGRSVCLGSRMLIAARWWYGFPWALSFELIAVIVVEVLR